MQDRPTFGAAREQPSARPASRLQSSQRPINVPMPNPAKPPKRAMDEDSSRIPSVKPGVVQQTDGKRRKTDEELEQPVRPTMAPPIRQSGVRKVCSLDSSNRQLLIVVGYHEAARLWKWILDHAGSAWSGSLDVQKSVSWSSTVPGTTWSAPRSSPRSLEICQWKDSICGTTSQPSTCPTRSLLHA